MREYNMTHPNLKSYEEALEELETKRGIKEGISYYKGIAISVHHFAGDTGKYSVLNLYKNFKTLKAAKAFIDRSFS